MACAPAALPMEVAVLLLLLLLLMLMLMLMMMTMMTTTMMMMMVAIGGIEMVAMATLAMTAAVNVWLPTVRT